jgi:glycosyltransferase involved in cell wall biosynthesis
VRVIYSAVNCGPGGARNLGLEQAHGEYIYFADADDQMDKTLVKDNLYLAHKYNADIVVFGYRVATAAPDGALCVEQTHTSPQSGVFDYDGFWQSYRHLQGTTSLWVRLFRRSYLQEKQIKMNAWSNGEDAAFLFDCYRAGFGTVAYNPRAYYTYVRRGNSATTKFREDRMECEFKTGQKYEETLNAIPQARGKFDDLIAAFYLNKLSILLTCVVSAPELSFGQRAKILRHYTLQERNQWALWHADMKQYSRVSRIKFQLLRMHMVALVVLLAKPKTYQ